MRHGNGNGVGACAVLCTTLAIRGSSRVELRAVGRQYEEGARQAPPAVDLPTAPSANPAEAARLVKAFLLSSRSEEPSVAEFTKDSGPLHLSLEPLQKLIAVFSVTECYMCQILSSPRRIVRSIGRADFNYTTFGAVVCKWVSFDLSRWRNRGGCAPSADRQIPASGDLCITNVCQDTRTEAEARKINGAAIGKTSPNPPTSFPRKRE